MLCILFTGAVATLTTLPFMKIVGETRAIAVKLLVPEDADESESEPIEHLWRAVRVGVDVLAIAIGAAGNGALLVLGLALSIPLIVIGTVLGWIVGEVIATDTLLRRWLSGQYGTTVPEVVEYVSAALGAGPVLMVGGAWRRAKLQGGYV